MWLVGTPYGNHAKWGWMDQHWFTQALARKLSSIQIPQTTTVVLTLLLTVVYLNILHAVQLHPIGPSVKHCPLWCKVVLQHLVHLHRIDPENCKRRKSVLTLVRACSVFSGALRYAWVTSLRGRGMYWRVKLLLGDGRSKEKMITLPWEWKKEELWCW